jgi:hypothetical protein
VKSARIPLLVSLAALWVAVVVAGCNTPQIPLPPPEVEVLEVALVDREAETIRLSGAPNFRTRKAQVEVINLETGFGVIAPAGDDGAFVTQPLSAAEGHHLSVSYSRGEDFSDALCIVVSYAGGQPPVCP